MSKHPNHFDGPLTKVLPAKERAKIIETGVTEMLDSESFRFASGKGYLNANHYNGPCGCAIGAVCVFLGGRDHRNGSAITGPIETGLVTDVELEALEQGYESGQKEWHGNVAKGPFFKLGLKLRARDDAAPSWQAKEV